MLSQLTLKVIKNKNINLSKPIKTKLLAEEKMKNFLDIHKNFSYYDLVNIYGIINNCWPSEISEQILKKYLDISLIEMDNNIIKLTPVALKLSIEYLILYGILKTCIDTTLTTYIEQQINRYHDVHKNSQPIIADETGQYKQLVSVSSEKPVGLNKNVMIHFLDSMGLNYDKEYNENFYLDLVVNIIHSLHTPYRPLASRVRLGSNNFVGTLYGYNRLRFWMNVRAINSNVFTHLFLNGMLDKKDIDGIEFYRLNAAGQAFVTHKYALSIHNIVYGRQQVVTPVFFLYDHVIF
jgi:hypothetical protein